MTTLCSLCPFIRNKAHCRLKPTLSISSYHSPSLLPLVQSSPVTRFQHVSYQQTSSTNIPLALACQSKSPSIHLTNQMSSTKHDLHWSCASCSMVPRGSLCPNCGQLKPRAGETIASESKFQQWFWPEFRASVVASSLPCPYTYYVEVWGGEFSGVSDVPVLGSAFDWKGVESVWHLGGDLMEEL